VRRAAECAFGLVEAEFVAVWHPDRGYPPAPFLRRRRLHVAVHRPYVAQLEGPLSSRKIVPPTFSEMVVQVAVLSRI
jgi:hypothetical protein